MPFEIFDLAVPLTPILFIQTVGIVILLMTFSYFSISAPSYFYYWRKNNTKDARLRDVVIKKEQLVHEISWSLKTILINSVLVTLLVCAWRLGAFPQFYLDPSELGWSYFALSIVLIILVQDALFYFAHRLLHHKKLIRFHAVHHRSKVPTPFVMYCFHPVEGLLHFIRIPLVMLIFPVSPLALIITEGLISNVINAYSHLNHEPRWLRIIKKLHGRSACTAVVHDMHHLNGKGNFGFYLRFWDDLFGTRMEETDTRVKEVHAHWDNPVSK